MNLIKQTALVLGLASLSIGGWTLYRSWRQKIAILFSILCFSVSIWALSFVSHATIGGRLSKDVHWFLNVWLSPLGVIIISQMFAREDLVSRLLKWVSLIGAMILSVMIALSLGSSSLFWSLVSFWPSFILLEYLYLMIHDLVLHSPTRVELISLADRKVLYLGLGISLMICSFDHIPFLGYTIPSIGNLLFTVYLLFVSQMINPQKIFKIEELLTRFFATLILALVITGFFALLYQYISETFPLFLLNSFLISFSILVLWSPLLTFFRFVGSKITSLDGSIPASELEEFKVAMATVTDVEALTGILKEAFKKWIDATRIRVLLHHESEPFPESVQNFFRTARQQKTTPILHRELIRMERDQILTQSRREEYSSLLQYLDLLQGDVVFPIFYQSEITALIVVDTPATFEDWRVSLGSYSKIFNALQEVGNTLIRLARIEANQEKDRLVLLGEMAAGLAHEIRNPLGAIRGAAELADPESNAWVKVIREEVNRLNRLVSQFLDFAHSPQEEPELVDLVEVIERTISNLQPTLKAGEQIEFNPEVKKIPILAVPDHLQQVLINLIQNAFKASESLRAEKSEVVIKIEAFETGFRVRDSGVGMSAEVLSKAFQPFFTSFQKGTGLGLAICERLVHLNGGKITLQSTLGVGTEVTVNFQPVRLMDAYAR